MGDLSTVFQTRSSIVSATQTSGSAVGSTPSMLSQGLRVPFLDHLGIPPKRSKSGGLGFLAAHRPLHEPHEADHDRGRSVWCVDRLLPDDELVRLRRSRRFAEKTRPPDAPAQRAMVWTSIKEVDVWRGPRRQARFE